ncbi:MAG: MgtC/SapB family protein [Thermoplasmata archaeon]
MDTYIAIEFLLISMGIGALIGLEREFHREEKEILIVGLRTMPLVTMAGTIIALLADDYGNYLVGVGLVIGATFTVLLAIIRHRLEMSGFTTPFAMFLAYICGMLIGMGFILVGLFVGVLTTILLFTKKRLHHIAASLTEDEMNSALQFLTILLILLPIVATYDFNQLVWNNYNLGEIIGRGKILDVYWLLLIIVFISTLSFVSFIAMRKVGTAKGLEVSGLLGGMVNSEAAAISLANIGKKAPAMEESIIRGILLANVTMLVRNFLLCIFSDPTLEVAYLTAIPFCIMIIANLVFVVGRRVKRFSGKIGEEEHRILIESPFAVGPAVKFGMIFAIISLVVYFAQHYGQDLGVYMTAVGGFVSSAAVVASVSASASSTIIGAHVAGVTVMLATSISTLNKYILVRTVDKKLTRKLLIPVLATFSVGLLGVFLVAFVI